MEDYKSNSHKAKAEAKEAAEKKVNKVVTGNVKRKKKSEVSKFKDVFISEDVSNVKTYIFLDVLVPAIKKAVSDIVKDGIDMMYMETNEAAVVAHPVMYHIDHIPITRVVTQEGR